MMPQVRDVLFRAPFFRSLWSRLRGQSGPPDHDLKQAAVSRLAAQYGARVFVESGTYRGDMVEAMKPHFDRLYSIELSETLQAAAAERFADDPRIEILQGDSGEVIQRILPDLSGPALFWLDGHYSGGVTARGAQDTPIWQELRHILDAPDLGHVILVDDARLFGRDPGYPTVEAVIRFAKDRRPGLVCDVQTDAIRLLPPAPPVKA